MDFKFAADVVYEHTYATHIKFCFYVKIYRHEKNANIVGYVWQR
jgi:hypothetical protein